MNEYISYINSVLIRFLSVYVEVSIADRGHSCDMYKLDEKELA